MAEFPKDKLFVVYCAGPHCNGANKAALRAGIACPAFAARGMLVNLLEIDTIQLI